MIKIGITGGIGSGKSTVCRIFQALNIPIYNADIQAAIITNSHPEVKAQLISLLGSEIYSSENSLDRKKLASIIFSDKTILEKVNSIIHPAVFNDYVHWCKLHEKFEYTLKEAAILFESGAYKQVDKVITVFAAKDIRIKRVMLREEITEEEVLRRMKNQMPEEKKLEKSDYVIYNDESKLLIPQVLELDEIIRKL